MRNLAVLLICLRVAGLVHAADAPGEHSTPPGPPPEGMVWIPGGTYRPVFTNEPPVEVKGFWLGRDPVTNAEFLRFVEANPAWRKSAVPRVFADGAYLDGWSGDLDPAPQNPAAPVVRISWFAARAYAQWKGARLPTQAEWELAAAASPAVADASGDEAFQAAILAGYLRPFPDQVPVVSGPANVFGARGIHGLVWEWVEDFNTALVTGESRGDSALERSRFCGTGALGASNFRDYPAFMRYALRSSLKGSYTMASMGLRLARDREEDDGGEEVAECCKGAAPAGVAPAAEGSVYALGSTWTDAGGRSVPLPSLAGGPRVVAMFFSNCSYACPLIVRNLKRLDELLDEPTRAASRVVMFSFDDRRDNPAALTLFARRMALDASRYTLLGGDAEAVRGLAAALGVSYRPVPGGDFAHSSQILVLDAAGVIKASVEDINGDLTPLVKALREAAGP